MQNVFDLGLYLFSFFSVFTCNFILHLFHPYRSFHVYGN